MELRYKPDFAEVLARFEGWWECEIVDRPLVTISVRPEHESTLPQKTHSSLRERWFDAQYAVDCFEAGLDGAVFMAETVPVFYPNLGPEVCATLFGCELEFRETTSWTTPIVASCAEILEIQPNLDTVYWNAIREMTQLSLRRGEGKWITGLTDLHTNGDLVASLRGSENLCYNLADDIDSVRMACEYVTQFYPTMFEDLWNRVAAKNQPCTTWTPVLHAGRMYVTNCDFICMISPEMFAEAILPSIMAEMDYLERNIFHLDGPGALQHLDLLLALPKLDGLQWIYGAGSGPASRWVEVYQKAQTAGKCIQLCCEDLNDALAVAEHLRPEGVWFCPGGQYSRDEAQAFINRIERWSAGKRV